MVENNHISKNSLLFFCLFFFKYLLRFFFLTMVKNNHLSKGNLLFFFFFFFFLTLQFYLLSSIESTPLSKFIMLAIMRNILSHCAFVQVSQLRSQYGSWTVCTHLYTLSVCMCMQRRAETNKVLLQLAVAHLKTKVLKIHLFVLLFGRELGGGGRGYWWGVVLSD